MVERGLCGGSRLSDRNTYLVPDLKGVITNMAWNTPFFSAKTPICPDCAKLSFKATPYLKMAEKNYTNN